MRGEILKEAHKIINGARQDQYGNPEDSLKLIGDYWSVYLERLTGEAIYLAGKDVAVMMVLLKIAREQAQTKPDNFIDAAGYIGLAYDESMSRA